MLLSRIVWVLTGLAWAGHSLMAFTSPDYWDPVTALDWASIWMYSLAWLLTAPTVLLIARLAPTRAVQVCAVVASVGAVVAGGANAAEDGIGVSSMGTWYVIGFFTAWLAIAALAGTLHRVGRHRLGWCVAGLFGGIFLMLMGGGLIMLVALGALAVIPDWFARPTVSPGPVTANPAT